MATPAAVLSILVKAQGVQAASAQLGTLDKSARKAAVGVKTAEANAKRSSKSFSMIGKTAGLAGVTLGAAGLAGGIKTAVSEFREAQKVGAQTNAVLKSTKSAANVTAKEIQNLAGAISRKTGIDDEAIQSSENMLLTFTKLRNETGKGNDIFNQATQTVTDMSVALGQSGKSSAIQLGKALNDPIKGITALRRVGVAFTADQQKQITTLENTGHHLEAQKIILRELRTEFAGSAVAQATAGDKFKVSLNNLAEAAGAVLVPQLDKAAAFFTKLMDEMVRGVGTGGALISTFQTTGNVIGSVVGVVSSLVRSFREGNALAVLLVGTLAALTAGLVAYRTVVLVTTVATRAMAAAQVAWDVALTVGTGGLNLIIPLIAAFAAAVAIAYAKSKTFREVVDTLWNALKTGLGGAIRFILGAFSSFLGAVSTVARALGRDGLADKAAAGQRAIDDLRDSLNKVPGHKDVEVAVKIKLDGQDVDVTKAKPLSPTPPGGDGPGVIGSRIGDLVRKSQIVKDGAKKLVADGLGSLIPGIGAGGKGVGSLMGANASLKPFAAVGAQFGLHVSSGKRAAGGLTSSGGVSYHGSGQAIDLANGAGPDAAKMAAFTALRSKYGSRLAELIYTPAGGKQIKDGHNFLYTGSVAADHFDHVHVAFTGGAGTALGQAGNRGDGLGRFVGDGLGNLNRTFPKHGSSNAAGHVQLPPDVVRQIAVGAGLPGPAFEQIAHGESTYFPGIVSNDGGWGLWQMTPRVWGAEAKAKLGQLGGIGEMLNPLKNAMMAKWLFDRGGLSPWYGTRYLTPEARATAGTAKGKKGPGFGALTGGGTADPSGASSGGGSNAVSGAASAAARVNPLDQSLATADLAIEQAKHGGTVKAPGIAGRKISSAMRQVGALTSKRALISKRIASIRKALKGKPSASKRLALTQELTQRLQEHAQLSTDIAALRNPAAADTGGTAGIGGIGGDGGSIGDVGGDPNQPLIDAINAAAEQAAEDARIKAEADAAHTQALNDLQAQIKTQNQFATDVRTVQMGQLAKGLADFISQQIGSNTASRAFTAGAGSVVRY